MQSGAGTLLGAFPAPLFFRGTGARIRFDLAEGSADPKWMLRGWFPLLTIAFCPFQPIHARESVKLVPIAPAWSENSVNATVFRRNAVTSHGDFQYAAFYDAGGRVVLAKRHLGSTDWEIRPTQFTGNYRDAHNVINIAVDGSGRLHMAWDHHGDPLHYARGVAPGSLEMGPPEPMVGTLEDSVTYTEFHDLPGGSLLLAYRDGASGNGQLVLNRYDLAAGKWSRLQSSLIDGEGQRSPYWQICVDRQGTIHVSWVWRESPDVASNHDLCYARSRDRGVTWEKSTGEKLTVPITAATAEYAARIPEGSELINQTSMTTDAEGRPFIACYWQALGDKAPQYRVVFQEGTAWQTRQVGVRMTSFTLKGAGTKNVPVSRPQILMDTALPPVAYVIFRDAERGSRVSVAVCREVKGGPWIIRDLTEFSVGAWEPSLDQQLWRRAGQLALYVQPVGQGDGEGLEMLEPQMASILEWTPE